MSVSGYSKIERGETKVAISKLKKVSEILGVDFMELMSPGEKMSISSILAIATMANLLARPLNWLLKIKNNNCLGMRME